jgi:hypothetical protein
MSIITSPLLLGADSGIYQISRSLRFSSPDSAYLSKNFASAGNRKTWTWAGWIKGLDYPENPAIFACTTGTTDNTFLRFRSINGAFHLVGYNTYFRSTSAVYRDPSAWYHVVWAVDTTQATAASRVKLYVNGVEVTAFSASNNPTQNDDLGINQATAHAIGSNSNGVGNMSGYLADIHFIDGQALDPSSFTTTDLTTGQLLPVAYTGSYGTNGFKLDFSSNATTAALGTDTSGNSNTWTVNNFSVTAGVNNDSLIDTPTSYGTDTGVGGEVRGNYCTWNPNDKGLITISNGNLETSQLTSGAHQIVRGTIGMSSGKWYWESTMTTNSGYQMVGILGSNSTYGLSTYIGSASTGYAVYSADGYIYNNNVTAPYLGSSYVSGDVIGVAFDADNGKLWFSKNGVFPNSGNPATGANAAYTAIPSMAYFPAVSQQNTTGATNFGQRAFAYTAPSGFKALVDTNLPAPVVAKPNTVMDVKLYTATDGVGGSISGVNFSPDFVWIKSRAVARSNVLMDTVRGTSSVLWSNLTDAQLSSSQYVSQFNSDGFNYGVAGDVSNSSTVAWMWDAGTTTVSNTQGSISSQVRANASAGFSVVTYTANGSNTATVGHSLGVKPALIIHKQRTKTESWRVYHTSRTSTGQFLTLNGTGGFGSSSDIYPAEPTSTVFTPGNEASMNSGTENCVAYCFAPVSGYSAALSWTGNGSNDGTMIHCGFSPRFWIWKRTDSSGDWWMIDTARSNTGNPVDEWLAANRSDAEYPNDGDFDFLSNGIKIRTTSTSVNASGGSYIGFAWASNPFQYARAQ